MSQDVSLILSIGTAVLIAAVMAFALMLRGRITLTVVLTLVVTGLSATFLLMAAGNRLSMWDGMGAVLLGLFILAPLALGLWLGLLTAWAVRRRRARRLGKTAEGR